MINKNQLNIKPNINKKPKLKKETNLPNSKINRLVFDVKENMHDNNDDDLDDVCNFSGINNKSYTNKNDYNYSNDFFNDVLDEELKRAKSPKPIMNKKSNFDIIADDLTEQIENNNISNNDNDIFENINININQINSEQNNNINNVNNNGNDDIKSSVLKEIINKHKNNNVNENKSISNCPKSISCSSNDNFSFKIKRNDKLNDSKKNNNINDNNINEIQNNNNNKIKNEISSIFDSRESSKFNFKINDDVHESEFNDIDFLD